jgi:glycosyltransferase involved in cell wall biosynthesis
MNVWYVSLYEPLPLCGKGVKPMRSSYICRALASRGISVELWIPSFEHIHHINYSSRHSFSADCLNVSVQYMKSIGYKKDVSARRFLNNKLLAREFKQLASIKSKPDLVITQIPALELAYAVSKYCVQNSIPYVVDIRDPWPENYKRYFPSRLLFLYKYLFFFAERDLASVLSSASGITAVSKAYLDWAILKSHMRNLPSKVFNIGFPASEDNREISENNREGLVIFFAGSFASNIDFELLITVAHKLSDNGYDHISFRIAGKGSLSLDIHSTLEKMKNISLLGWLDSGSLIQEMHSADVGILLYNCSAMQSLPNKPFEYMAHGLALLNPLSGEMSDIVKNKNIGLNYNPLNDSLYYAIIDLNTRRDLLFKMRVNSFNAAINDYDTSLIYSSFPPFLNNVMEYFYARTEKN